MKSRVEHQCRQCRTFDSFEIQAASGSPMPRSATGRSSSAPHGGSVTSSVTGSIPDFAAFFTRLAEGFRVVRLRPPGHRLKRSRRAGQKIAGARRSEAPVRTDEAVIRITQTRRRDIRPLAYEP